MKCPFCSSEDSQVKDSRPTEDSSAIRRRRVCSSCGARFTTFERIQLRELLVKKSDGKVQTFDRDKISKSMAVALRKRPIDEEQIEKAVTGIVRQLESAGDTEIPAEKIGEHVMQALINLDVVGYIRYTSVYRDFRNPDDFNDFLKEVQDLQEANNKPVKKSA
ncbi:MAG: transcriptional regulator NrdR [Pseudomonadota bacterium]